MKTPLRALLGGVVAGSMAAPALAGGILINEARIDQTGTDNDEYFELIGPPGASLDDLTYIVIGDGSTGSGTIEAVVPLAGLSMNANGFFVVAESTFTLGVADYTVPGTLLNFENSDNVTHVLVSGFTGANADDLDLDDDGVLDVTPWTAVLDAVGFLLQPNPPSTTEYLYGETLGGSDVGPDGSFVPGHLYRCTPGGGWRIGIFDPAAPGLDTPGAANPECDPDADGDNIPDAEDNCPDTPNPDQADCNANGIGDACEVFEDCNQNGLPDDCDIALGTDNDCNGNNIPDACDYANDVLHDVNGDGVADECFVNAPKGLQLSEIRHEQTGADNDEYFEISGASGTSLQGLRYIVIGDGTGGSGVVEAVVNLDGTSIPGDGLYLGAEDTFTLTSIFSVDLLLSGAQNQLNFEGSDNVTHVLVANWHGVNGQDLDLDDDGVLDVTPWTSVIDAIGLLESDTIPPTGTVYAYGAALGFEDIGPEVTGTGTFVPAHVYRCSPDGTWTMGVIDLPPVGVDTPGDANVACGSGNPCPEDLDQSGDIGFGDLLVVLSSWGPCFAPCPEDLDANGDIGFSDVLAILSTWGPCP